MINNTKKHKNKPQKGKKIFNIRSFLLIFFMVMYFVSAIISTIRDVQPISGQVTYDELVSLITDGETEYIRITKDSDKIFIAKKDGSNVEALNPKSDNFIEDLYKLGANIELQQTSVTNSIVALLTTIPVMLLMSVLAIYIVSTAMGGNTKQFTLLKHNYNQVTFDDIQGLSETKQEVKFIVDSLKNWKKLESYGARPCKGILFYGPPGTGKTMLAKAIAKEAKVNFISCSGSDFNEMFVGVGAARVRQLWELATTNAPCIVFIDEIDCLGKRRRGGDGASRELSQTLNALLQKMDGINTLNGIMVIGATNRKEDLDKALLRPGRFDRHYYIGAPDNKKDRDEIVNIYIKDKKLSDNITTDQVSKLLVGLTGAEIENTINEAIFNSIMDGREGIIQLKDIDEAVMKNYTSGVKKEHTSERDLEITSYHEAGHTLVSLLLNKPISKVSIIPYSSGMGGVTMPDLDELQNQKFKLQSDLENELKILLAGKVAEEVIYGEHSQGCSNDIEKSTDLVYKMITEYGYNSKTLLNERVLIEHGLKLSIETKLVDSCNELLEKFNDETINLIKNNLSTLKNIASTLRKEKTIVSPQLEKFVD